ncbi:F0F1 ATP synthase subunit epsilon [uncultured Roseibium sp.]|uniref:F0F1 ATP synthase subunit epsilon n=1 Tax=uncultured Roseibium sp. TaxID=1936171 RepID=UPI002609B6C7|nr:F0F1 ATP synthase subunit epsilon [uncultured Roseibium sp.]
MAELFQFELVSPEHQLLSAHVAEVIVPGTEGEFGVLKDHAPVVSTINPGILKVRNDDGAWAEYFVRGGFAEVSSGVLSVLAEQAVPVSEISMDQLDQAIRNAEEDAADAKDDQARQKAEMTLAQLRDVVEALKKA